MTGAVLLVVFSLGLGGFDRILTRFTVETTGLGPRRGIWQDAMQVARRFPWTGSGLNTFRAAVAGSQTGHPGDRPTAAPAYRAAAHNDYLQLAAEGGVLVSVPAAILIVVFARAVRRRLRESVADPAIFWIRVGAVLGMTSIGLQELVDFSLQIPANAVLFTVLAALAIGGPAPSSSPAASPSRHGVLSST
jgi:O-antigen ligase